MNDFHGPGNNHLYGLRSRSSNHPLDQFRGGARPHIPGGGVAGPSQPPPNELFDTPFCPKHAPENRESQGWAEKENGTLLPIVCIGMATLGANLKAIIKSHNGSVPLSTLVHCYEAECEPLPVDPEDGVPLEHLITCVKGVQIQPGLTGIKSVCMIGNDDEVWRKTKSKILVRVLILFLFSSLQTASSTHSGSTPGSLHSFSQNNSHPQFALPSSTINPYHHHQQPHGGPLGGAGIGFGGGPGGIPTLGGGPGAGGAPAFGSSTVSPLAKQLAFFSRELVELLKSQPGCVMLFNKFIPSYHHHFGRQCR